MHDSDHYYRQICRSERGCEGIEPFLQSRRVQDTINPVCHSMQHDGHINNRSNDHLAVHFVA